MKKKIILIVSIVLVAVTACALLVGCTASTPFDFMEKWFNAEKKSYFSYSESSTLTSNVATYFDGNLIKSTQVSTKKDSEGNKVTTTNVVIVEFSGKDINYYYGTQTDNETMTWEVSVSEYDEDETMPSMKRYFNGNIEIHEVITDIDKEDFQKNFKKKDGWYQPIIPVKYDYIGIKFTAKEMLIKDDIDEDIEFSYKYAIGSEDISIPAEATKALVEYKKNLEN